MFKKIGMTYLILLLISKLIFCEVTPTSINDKFYDEISDNNKHRIQDDKIPERDVSNITNYRLSNNIIPEHYVMKLDLSNVKNYKISSIYGEISIDLRINRPTKTVDFHAQKPYIKIRNYIFLQQLNSHKYVIKDPVEKSYIPSSHIFVLYFAEELSQGNYVLKMEFDCNADEAKSFFQTTYINTRGEKKWVAATRFQGIGARQVFPCWDEPALRATFSIGIKHHSNYTVLSNMHTYKVDHVTTNIMWRMFDVTPPIPTHLVGFTMFDPTSVYCISYSELLPSHLEFAQKISKRIGNTVSTIYILWLKNITTNVEEMQHVAIPNFPDNVMVNWRLNFYRLSDIIYEKGKDPVMRKIKVARLIAWGIIQQFIGNMVSPSWWSSLWLNDGIIMSFVMDILSEDLRNQQIRDLLAVEYQYESLHLDCGLLKPLTWKIINSSEINSLFLYPRYAKAVTILNMLKFMLIEYYSDREYIDSFDYGFQKYFLKFFFKAAKFDDFWVAIESAQHELIETDKYVNVSRIMNAWITQPQYPVLKIKQYNKTIDRVTVLSKKFNVSQIDHRISFFFDTTLKIMKKIPTTFNNNKWQKMSNETINIDEFLLENYGDEKENVENLLFLSINGYFRVNYDVKIWDRIIHLLVPKDPPKQIELPIQIKAKLIDDAFHFVVAHKLSSKIFWKMSQFLKEETNYIVWYPMFKVFEYISRLLPLTEFATGTAQQIKEDVQFLYRNYKITTSNIDFRELPQNDILNCLMQEMSKWACVFHYDECITKAKNYLMDHITNPSVNKILPWWKKWTFCYGMDKSYEMWAKVLNYEYNILDLKESSKILELLCCTKNIDGIKFMLMMVYDKIKFYETKVPNLQVRDRINIFSLIIAKHARNNEVLDFVLSNFEKLKPREISTVAALINIINHVYFKKQLEQINEFVHNNLKELIAYVEQKIEIRWVQLKSLYNDYIIL